MVLNALLSELLEQRDSPTPNAIQATPQHARQAELGQPQHPMLSKLHRSVRDKRSTDAERDGQGWPSAAMPWMARSGRQFATGGRNCRKVYATV